MPGTGAILNINIEGSETIKIIFKKSTGESLNIDTQLSSGRINALNEKLYEALDTFISKISDVNKVNLKTAAEAILHLHKVGAKLMGDLFGIEKGNVKKFMNATFPLWRISQREAYLPPKVEITSTIDNYIPFEFYPLFETLKPNPIQSHDDLLLIASRFLGFTSITNRSFHPPNSGTRRVLCNGILDNLPKLKVRLFKHHGLKGQREEEIFLESCERVEFHNKWPVDIDSDLHYVEELSKLLWYSTSFIPGAEETSPQPLDHIHYFSCHCNPDAINSNKYRMLLTYRKGFFPKVQEVNVGISDLSNEFGELDDRDSESIYPLIFLNACGSNRRTTNGVTSFPDLFLRNGNRGIIGTEASIPDEYANKFAALFYKYLIDAKTVGEAIFFSKWDMLKNSNPICLLYTLYGNPDLRVKRPS